jgi:hypothetical protein
LHSGRLHLCKSVLQLSCATKMWIGGLQRIVQSAANPVISADLKTCRIILHSSPQQNHFASGTAPLRAPKPRGSHPCQPPRSPGWHRLGAGRDGYGCRLRGSGQSRPGAGGREGHSSQRPGPQGPRGWGAPAGFPQADSLTAAIRRPPHRRSCLGRCGLASAAPGRWSSCRSAGKSASGRCSRQQGPRRAGRIQQ